MRRKNARLTPYAAGVAYKDRIKGVPSWRSVHTAKAPTQFGLMQLLTKVPHHILELVSHQEAQCLALVPHKLEKQRKLGT